MTVEKQRLRLHGGRISRNGDPYAKRFAPRLHRQVRQRYERTTRRSEVAFRSLCERRVGIRRQPSLQTTLSASYPRDATTFRSALLLAITTIYIDLISPGYFKNQLLRCTLFVESLISTTIIDDNRWQSRLVKYRGQLEDIGFYDN